MSTLDEKLNIAPDKSHHTRASTEQDEKLVLKELVHKSAVFQHIPGRQHRSFNKISPSIMEDINPDEFITWIQNQRKKLLDDLLYHETLKEFS